MANKSVPHCGIAICRFSGNCLLNSGWIKSTHITNSLKFDNQQYINNIAGWPRWNLAKILFAQPQWQRAERQLEC